MDENREQSRPDEWEVYTGIYLPKPEDEVLANCTATCLPPLVPGAYNPYQYAENIAAFLRKNCDLKTNIQVREAIGKLVLSAEDFFQSQDSDEILSDLHLAEAEVRGITPFQFREVIHMQERLFAFGYGTDSLINQRTEIMEKLISRFPGDNNLRTSCVKTIALGLCVDYEKLLREFEPDNADQLLSQMETLYAEQVYNHKIMYYTGQRLEDNYLITRANNELQKLEENARNTCLTFMHNFSPDIQPKVIRRRNQLQLQAIGNEIKYGFRQAGFEIQKKARKVGKILFYPKK